MKTIWKFPIAEMQDKFVLKMPIGAEVLTVQVQRNAPCLWAKVESNNPLKDRAFFMYGTGHDIKKLNLMPSFYIGSFQLFDGDLVFHLFEQVG